MKINRTLFVSAIAAALLSAGASATRADGNYTLGWGGNNDGQLAIAANAKASTDMIAAGAYHSLALIDQRIYGWGSSDYGALDYPGTAEFTFVAAGLHSGLAIRSDGQTQLWGGTDNAFFQPEYTNMVQAHRTERYASASLGAYHGLLLSRGNVVRAWGKPLDGSDQPCVTIPNEQWTANFTAIAAGEGFSVGISNGCVHVADSATNRFKILDIPAAASNNVKAIAAGRYHAMALTESGQVVVWGAWFDENARALPRASYGDVTTIPARVPASGNKAISAGWNTCAVLTSNGEVIVWGNELGVGGALAAVPAYASNDVHEISLGYEHILVRSSHLPPEFTGTTLPDAYLNSPYTNSVPVRADPAATVSLTGNRPLPAGIVLNADGTFSGSPTKMGTNIFQVTAANAYGSATREFTIVVRDEKILAPTFITTNLPPATVGFPYLFKLEATYNPTFTADVNLPGWAHLDPDGTLSGTPGASDQGNSYPVFTASNSEGSAASRMTLTVNPQSADTPPVIGLDPFPELRINVTTNIDLCITGAYSVALSGALASGSEWDISPSGDRWILTITPAIQGDGIEAIVTAINDGASATKTYPVDVVGAPVWTTPETLAAATPGAFYSATLEASFATSYSLGGSLPPGLAFDGSSSVAVISGTLGATSATSFSIPVTAVNDHGSTNRTFVIPVSTAAGDFVFTSIVPSTKDSTVTLTWQSKSKPDAPTSATLVTSPDLTWPDSSPSISTNSPATIPLPAAPAFFRLLPP